MAVRPRAQTGSPSRARLVAWRPRRHRDRDEVDAIAALREDLEHAQKELQSVAASVVHDLRTPLAALSGEVELALYRERTPAVYREALARIGDQLARLVEWTDDLAILSAPQQTLAMSGQQASLATALDSVGNRCRSTGAHGMAIEACAPDALLVGSEALLTRALSLLVEHGLRYRGEGGRVCLRVAADDDPDPNGESVTLALEVAPPRFPGRTWHHLTPAGGDDEPAQAPGLVRLRIAARIFESCGGSLVVQSSDGLDAVRIRLVRVPASGEDAR